MKFCTFNFRNEADVLYFLKWHNYTKKNCFVRYRWDNMCKNIFDSINIVKTSIANKSCVMKIPYVETREVTYKDLIGTTIEVVYKSW